MAKQYLLKELSRYEIGTFADIIYRNTLLYPDREAFICGSERITFAGYNARVNSLVHALQSREVTAGDVIGLLSFNCLEYADVYGAAMKGGFIASPLNPRLQAKELEYLINYSEANTLFIGPDLIEAVNSLRGSIPGVKNFISLASRTPGMEYLGDLLSDYSVGEPDVRVTEDNPLFLIYTSGTTGTPRGALYTHHKTMDNTMGFVILKSLQPGDKHLTFMPLFHIGAIENFLGHLYIGGSNVIMNSFDPASALRAIREERPTDIQIVPTHLAAIFALPDYADYDLSSVKRILYVGSPMPVELLKKGLATWGPIFMQSYGQTETGPGITGMLRDDHRIAETSPDEASVLGSCGQPLIGVHTRIVDEYGEDVAMGEIGEIIVKSKHTMVEYWHKPDDTRSTVTGGWLHTGDLGRYDERGFIYIVDRKKDMIISGGENIYAREVEEVLYRHPAVLEAAVIGVPDPYWVERVHAVVSLKQGANVTDDELKNFCKQRLAHYKAPKSVEFVSALPKSAAGKILKKELKEKVGCK